MTFSAAALATSISAEPVSDYPVASWYKAYQCRMHWNPAYTTTEPYGVFYLVEEGAWAPMRIRGFMHSMPTDDPTHGFSINANLFDGNDCATTEPTWNPYNEQYGQMNTWQSQVGDIDPVIHNSAGDADYSKTAWNPTLYGMHTIEGLNMVIYEDFGAHENYYGRQIACC